MGWFLRKSLRLLPGVHINISKSGPRLSVGLSGARASIGVDGKTRLYGGIGPLRYQKIVNFGVRSKPQGNGSTLLGLVKWILGGR